MRLLYITNGINGPGGLERVLSVKASYFAEKLNYEIHIVTLNGGNKNVFYDFSPKIKTFDIALKSNPVRYYLSYLRGIRRAVRSIEPDVILVCDDGLKGFLVPQFVHGRYKTIYERHATIQLNYNKLRGARLRLLKEWLLKSIMSLLAKSYDSFIVLSSGDKRNWNNDNVVVIPNPLSFFPQEIASLERESIIVVGSHSYNKGYDLLLKAWALVAKQHPTWYLNVYGKVDDDRTYINLAKSLGLLAKVSFYDPVINIAEKYLESSIMALPSRSEGFGMVLIEAMACGVPCVAFDCPHGPADIISDGVDGYLVENGDYAELANRIVFLIENVRVRREFGAEARKSAARYLPENVTPLWDNLFTSIKSD